MFHTFNLKGYKLGVPKRLALHLEEEDGKKVNVITVFQYCKLPLMYNFCPVINSLQRDVPKSIIIINQYISNIEPTLQTSR